jgi:hypothetical protein
MNRIRASIIFSIIVAIGSSGIFFSSCKKKSMDGMIIFTRTAGKVQNINYITGDSWRYIPQAQIVELDPLKPGASVKILTSAFYSARSPQISHDGENMLFCAQQKQTDPWQIWEMDLKNLKSRQVIKAKENCTDPAYLPLGRLVFSKLSVDDKLKGGHSLYTCNMDGSELQRITFSPHTYFASNVLSDGRILTIDRQVYPNYGNPMYIILRPDGTKTELFYKDQEGNRLSGQGLETANGRIVFIESDNDKSATGNIISISYNRPLHSKVSLTSETKGDFHSVFPQHSGKLLVSYRKSESDRYGLFEFDPETKALGKALYNNNDFDVLEAVEADKHERPKKLPSEVHMDIKTGLIVCQDINLSDPQLSGKFSVLPKIFNVEIMGIDSSLGVFQAKTDGSFYLRISADTPFQIRSLDKNGHVIQTCDWIWLRPNERRGCVGCHEDPELVPENRIPLAVKKSPISVPVHIKKIKEKMIDTE